MSALSAAADEPGTPGHQLRQALGLLGDQWTLLIMQSVFLRVRRYDALRRRLGISPTALAGRLRAAVQGDLLVRAPYRDQGRTRHEYRLTERGLALWPLLISIWSWEREWVPGRRAVLPALHHTECGAETAAPLGCGHCLSRVDVREVSATRRIEAGVGVAIASTRFRRRDADALAHDPLTFFPDTMELLGDKWSTGLLVSGLLGARHFSEFERELGIGPSVLSDRLSRLVAQDVMRTGRGRTRTDARDYRLTEKGRAFFPALAFVADWSRGFALPGEPADILLRHLGCGRELAPVLLCDHCGQALTRTGVDFSARPAPAHNCDAPPSTASSAPVV